MKRGFSIILVIVLLLCFSACNSSPIQSDGNSHPSNSAQDSPGKGNDTSVNPSIGGSAWRIPINEQNVRGALRACISKSRFIVEGTVCSKKTIESGEYSRRGVRNDVPWDMYTFEDLEVLCGKYDQESLTLQVIREVDYSEKNNAYEIGKRYILIVWSRDRVYVPEDEVFYQDMRTRCLLNGQDHNKIESLVVEGFPTNILKTKQQLLQIVEEEIGISDEYYNILDNYIHSDNIEEIIAASPIILRVVVTRRAIGVPEAVVNGFDCTVREVLKWEEEISQEENILIHMPTRYVEINREYLVLCYLKAAAGELGEYAVEGDRNHYEITAKKIL